MQQDTINSRVRVDFYFCSNKLDFDSIDYSMGIVATKKTPKEKFAIEEFAKDYWILSTGYEESEDINIQLSKIVEVLSYKTDVIKEVCHRYDAECGFCIVTELHEDIIPAIYFEREFLKFVTDVHAEINVDFT